MQRVSPRPRRPTVVPKPRPGTHRKLDLRHDGRRPDIVSRILDPFTECLTPEVARRVAAFQAPPATQSQLDVLADKANEGLLTAAEQAEYDRYRSVFHFVTILQSKARAFLKRHAAE